MNKKIIVISLFGLSLFLMGSCVKNTLFDLGTNNPEGPEEPALPEPEEKSTLIISINWDSIMPSDAVDSLIITVADTLLYQVRSNDADTLILDPGSYEIIIYNLANNTFKDENAIKVSKNPEDYIVNNPQPFYFQKTTELLKANDTAIVTISPAREMRDLIIKLEIPSDKYDTIRSISGYLTNVASTFNLNNKEKLNESSMFLSFESTLDSCRSTLFGIINDNQELHLKFMRAYDSIVFNIDVSSRLRYFNEESKTDKKIIIIEENEIHTP